MAAAVVIAIAVPIGMAPATPIIISAAFIALPSLRISVITVAPLVVEFAIPVPVVIAAAVPIIPALIPALIPAANVSAADVVAVSRSII